MRFHEAIELFRSFAAVHDGRWHWGFGDPDLGAVLVTGLYLLTSIICLAVARQLRLNPIPLIRPMATFSPKVTGEGNRAQSAPSSGLRPPSPPSSGAKGLEHRNPPQPASRHLLPRDQGRRTGVEARFWLVLALLLFLLGVNKQGDFQSLLTLYGRDILQQAGLYEGRHTIQIVFIASVAGAAVVSLLASLWIVRRLSRPCLWATAGLGLQAAFVVIRAASFHRMNFLLGQQLGDLKLNLLIESIGLFVILLSAMAGWAAERAAIVK